MTLLLIPAPATNAAATPSEIQTQIRNAYKAALRGSGKSSFNGHCGGLVSWQTYSLGIDKELYYCNGNDQFNMYSAMEKTTGGYGIKTYPATKYTLLQALNAISNNGTRDVYNMIVGFQKTNTAAGQKYGHALLIHAIIDGIVYFVECYDAYIGGKYYSEGKPISCTIKEFATYYDRWTVFEGVIYFGLKTYATSCTKYSCAMKAMVMEDTQLYEEPGDPGIHEPKAAGTLLAGQWLTVSALLKTPNGKYWYQVEDGNLTYYVEAEKLAMGSVDTSGLTISNLKAPGGLRKAYGFNMSGTILSGNSTIRDVKVSVYSVNDRNTELFSATMDVNGKTASLASSKLNNALTFRKLPVGTYLVKIDVNLELHVFNNGKVETRLEKIGLWEGQCLIVSDKSTYPTVTFDGNGGKVDLNQIVVKKNATLSDLPTAQRSGYAFAGWTLDKAGNKPVTADTVITKNTTLYAQWTAGHSGNGGWQETADGWHYCAGNSPVAGWIQFGDLQFYQYSDGTFAKGWAMIEDDLRYFNAAGALITRLDGPSGTGFEVNTEGNGTLGWQVSGNEPSGFIELSPEEVQQRLEQVEKMPAAGRVMQKLSASLYYLAVRITSGELPHQLQEALNQE